MKYMMINYKYSILLGLFVTALLVANTVASKLIMVGGVVITTGIIAYPITFAITDIINEVWGKKAAKQAVMVGLFANLLMVGLYAISVAIPHASFWEGQPAFTSVLGSTPRIVLASMIAYLVSQTWDIHMFDKIKALTKGKHLWVRNNASTFTSQVIDSIIFLLIAFYGTIPVHLMPGMLVGYLAIKWAIALIDTPFVYLGTRWARRDN